VWSLDGRAADRRVCGAHLALRRDPLGAEFALELDDQRAEFEIVLVGAQIDA
jgi:hypothetical protein